MAKKKTKKTATNKKRAPASEEEPPPPPEKLKGVVCIYCGSAMHHVISTNPMWGAVNRRRQCDRCGKRWNTREK